MSSSHCTLGTQSSNLAEICSLVNWRRSGSGWLVSPPGGSVQRNVVDGALTRGQRLLRAVVVDEYLCVYMESFQKIFLDRVKHHLLHEERVSSLEVSFLFPSMFFWLNLPWDLIDQMEQHDLSDSQECKHYLVFSLDWRDWRLGSGHILVPRGNLRILRHPEIRLQVGKVVGLTGNWQRFLDRLGSFWMCCKVSDHG